MRDCWQSALHDSMKWLSTVCIAWLCTHCMTVSIAWMYGINAWLGALQYSVYCLNVCTAWLCNFLHCAPRYCVHRLIAYSVNVSSKLIFYFSAVSTVSKVKLKFFSTCLLCFCWKWCPYLNYYHSWTKWHQVHRHCPTPEKRKTSSTANDVIWS